MTKNKLSRLEEVELKDFWKHEEYDFTPWLSEDENIALLGETIGMDLEVQETEKNVGPYRADILCKDTSNGEFVVIENQLEATDHKHLGQVITYGTGLNASTCIWIARSFTEEHRAAIDWLNSITGDDHNFFAIEIKLYKIGDSPLAPIFNVVAKPNDWSKSVKKGVESSPRTDTEKQQEEFWTGFAEYVTTKQTRRFRTQKPQAQHWSNISIGSSAINLALTVDSRLKVIKIWLQIKGDNRKAHFEALQNKLFDTSKAILVDGELTWDEKEDRKQCCVELKTNGDFKDKSDWDRQFQWFFNNVINFIDVFQANVKGMR